MPESDLTWSRVVRIWWLILWRTLVGGFILGLLFNILAIIVGEVSSTSFSIVSVVGRIGGGILGVIWGIVALRMALRKEYRDFRIALVSTR